MSVTERIAPAAAAPPLRVTLERAARTVAAGVAVGAALGLLVGGIGGRLAMRVLFLTSDPSVRGLISDDGFAIGRFDLGATSVLLLLGTAAGVLGAFVYLGVRPFLLGPRWARYATCAAAAGAVVGALLVHADGVDFTLLGPRWFAIALFVAIPALFALLAAPAIDRAVRPGGWFARGPLPWVLTPLLLLVPPPLLVLGGVPALLVVLGRHALERRPALYRLATQPATLWAVRAVWAAIAVVGGVALVRDAAAILG